MSQAIDRFYIYISLIILILLSNSGLIAQINFEKGYVIDNNNQRTECLIKNQDWNDSPVSFKYKLSDSGAVLSGSISDFNEFGLLGSYKYVRVNVNIDRSPTKLNELSTSKEPIWSKEQVFLKVLLTGKASLFVYTQESNFTRYFYSVSDRPIQQLVYKQYMLSKDTMMTNFMFRQQLWRDVQCDKTPKELIQRIRYNQKDLINYFKKYNLCFGDSSVDYEKKSNHNREVFNLRVTPGLNYCSATFTCSSTLYLQGAEFARRANLRLGLEFEFILPFNRNKWGAFLEPYYKSFNDKQMIEGYDSVIVNYKAIELSLGLRHYFFLNEDTKLFINAIFNPGVAFNFNSTVNYLQYYEPLEITNSFNFGFGAGLNYKRLSTELRYYSNRNLLSKIDYYSCYYHELAFIIAYRIWQIKK